MKTVGDGWANGQMKDTKMSDSLPTVVAMRSNSQHQSDKLSRQDGTAMEMSRRLATQEDIQAGLNKIYILTPCPNLTQG